MNSTMCPAEDRIGEGGSRKQQSLPDFGANLNLKYVKLGYAYLLLSTNAFAFTVVAYFAMRPLHFLAIQHVPDHWQRYVGKETAAAISAVVIFTILIYRKVRRNTIFLVEISCFRPPALLRSPHSTFLEHSKVSKIFDEESLEFQRTILQRSGLGPSTAFPMCFRYLPPKPSMKAAAEESQIVLFTCMKELLEKTKVNPKDIGIVVVNCSTFSPAPSLAAAIVNKFKLRSNVRTYNLAGMGCSAGVIAVDLAKDVLQVHNNTYAVLLSHENITQNWYWGNDRTMLVSNCLFRVGGSAVLLSNKRSDRWRSKYRLDHVVRTHKAADNAAYHAAFQEEDSEGKLGVFLSKDIMKIAADTLRLNMTSLGPLVLPFSEQLLYFANIALREVFKAKVPTYVPNFKRAFNHFCIHSGGKAVITAVEKGLNLAPLDVEPTRMSLHRFGNTSACSTWYQFQYLEAKGRMRKGEKIWQIGFGSGFKCNSAVWTVLYPPRPFESRNAWSDCILDYPVSRSESRDF